MTEWGGRTSQCAREYGIFPHDFKTVHWWAVFAVLRLGAVLFLFYVVYSSYLKVAIVPCFPLPKTQSSLKSSKFGFWTLESLATLGMQPGSAPSPFGLSTSRSCSGSTLTNKRQFIAHNRVEKPAWPSRKQTSEKRERPYFKAKLLIQPLATNGTQIPSKCGTLLLFRWGPWKAGKERETKAHPTSIQTQKLVRIRNLKPETIIRPETI